MKTEGENKGKEQTINGDKAAVEKEHSSDEG